METLNRKNYIPVIKTEFIALPFYRDLLAEFVSTFFLTLSSLTLGMSWGDKPNTGTTLQLCLGMMFSVCCLAWGLGEFGGIHMNPIVTFAMTILREMTITRAILYLVIQCAAASVATLFIKAVLPPLVTDLLGPTVLHPDVKPWQGFLIEVWLSCYLMLTVLGSTDGTRKPEGVYVPPIFICMTVATCICSGVKATGCSMNPALTFGPALVTNIWDDHWVYWAGPLTGSAVATLLYKVIFDMVDNPSTKPRRKAAVYKCDSVVPMKRQMSIESCTSTGFKHFVETNTDQVQAVSTPRPGDRLRRRRLYTLTGSEPEHIPPRTRGLYG